MRERGDMVYPLGIENAKQRIQEIRARFEAFQPPATVSSSSGTSFDALLNQHLEDPINSTETPESLNRLVNEQASEVGLDQNLIKAVIKAESGFNPNAVSKAGAVGLMQLMPETGRQMGVEHLTNPAENIQGGSRYLKSLLDKYQDVPRALAAYNAGPGAVDRFQGIPPYKETQNYVKRVLSYQHQFEMAGKE